MGTGKSGCPARANPRLTVSDASASTNMTARFQCAWIVALAPIMAYAQTEAGELMSNVRGINLLHCMFFARCGEH